MRSYQLIKMICPNWSDGGHLSLLYSMEMFPAIKEANLR